jgi:hypothetical protein
MRAQDLQRVSRLRPRRTDEVVGHIRPGISVGVPVNKARGIKAPPRALLGHIWRYGDPE